MTTATPLPPPLNPPQRILLGPGPSDVPPRVLQALASPTIGHLDPEYLRVMDDMRELLRQVFRTRNELTVAMPGTGSSGMESCVANLIEPGDEMIVCVNGVFGGRMKDVAERCGAKAHVVEVPWGETFDSEDVARALEDHPKTKVVGIVHAETSTGAHQPLIEISELVHDAGALLLVDAVTSLGGVELAVDTWRIDACYSGSQKCLSCPPGLAPVTLSPAAFDVVKSRKTKVQSWYLDLSLIARYWGESRVYHHTAPVNMSYALYEALRIVVEEGLAAREARHLLNHKALRAGLLALGLTYIPDRSLPDLNAVRVPEGVDDARVRRRLLQEYGIEIGAGLGPFKGQAWRIGLMGHSSTRRNVTAILAALETLLPDEGVTVERGAAVAAAGDVYGAEER
jgi:alanine-glyoxylate transaminase/serine-glyoxylate transaminase/serine-pyruvate transaminase